MTGIDDGVWIGKIERIVTEGIRNGNLGGNTTDFRSEVSYVMGGDVYNYDCIARTLIPMSVTSLRVSS